MANCFVIIPFRPELTYLYRPVKAHVESAFPEVSVERGDDRVLTGPLLDKIVDYIRQADVIVADCSGRNPNVFYELGRLRSELLVRRLLRVEPAIEVLLSLKEWLARKHSS